jgi:anti-anti-sigma factor
MSTAKENAMGTIHIEGEMTIYRAAELKETLLKALTASSVLEVDLHGVTEVDSAGIQLLMLTKATGQTIACEVKLVNHSPAVLEVFELLDLAAHFGDPLLMPA